MTTDSIHDQRPPYAGTRPPRLSEIPAFVDHIARDWGHRSVPVALPEGTEAAAAEHRRRLSHALPGRAIVAAAGTAPIRNDDSAYGFRADSDFVWLTGVQVEGAVLVMTPTAGGHDSTVYLPPPLRPGTEGFFSDALHGELWVGSSPGIEEWSRALDLPVRDIAELETATIRSAEGPAWSTRVVPEALRAQHGLEVSQELRRTLSQLRMIKDEWEIEQLRHAVDATVGGFAAVATEIPRALAQGLGERWLQGTFERHSRTHGNGPGYSTIVGSGPNAPILHWTRCDGPILPDSALLLDMGVEARSLYTADVTRTLPVSGTFSTAQRRVHDLVERSHRTAMSHVRPGVNYLEFHFAAMEVLAQGLHDWGILPVSVDEALSPAGQQHRRYLVCGIGHHLGLDVHDCSQAQWEDYMGADLEAGMVMTVEPGLYFHENDLTVPPELRGIGVRLEDDLLLTASGAEVLSEALPIDAIGIENWTRSHASSA
ncbi:MAG TPA: aminopeptidase P family protein [Candidatus Brachybacterium merdavium]|uniref:Xaa-Pro aminopeptidase n=1 Tax=Candidatus Brachybacterium merdavium TaxID=2838513 RepID=A0A9D2LAP2_9MICO|nr:aminopeptidase P family protein [Candidatus Brachybacterium merdavium]